MNEDSYLLDNMVLPLKYPYRDLAFRSFLNNEVGISVAEYAKLAYSDKTALKDQFNQGD